MLIKREKPSVTQTNPFKPKEKNKKGREGEFSPIN